MRKILFTLFVFLLAVGVFSIVVWLLILNKSKGALQVTSSPNAKVYLNDKLLGETPLCKCDLKDMIPQGDYTIKLVPVSGNFGSFEQKITIEPKILTVIDRSFAENGLDSTSIINLNQIDDKKDAQVSITTFPQGAQVFIDNNLAGQSPLLLKNVKQADHELRFNKDGYKDKVIRIKVVLGFRLNAVIYMALNPDIASKSIDLKNSSLSATLKEEKVKILDTPTGFLRVRKEASVSAAEIAQVLPENIYTLLDEAQGWFKIKLDDGQEGWISSQYASKLN